jgi:hypothetical protein
MKNIKDYVDDEGKLFLSAHIIAEDPRYPTLCINGHLNFGLTIDPITGEIGKHRMCICESRRKDECICDLGD